jgi:Domain of unknown function (DUF1707)
MRIGDAERDAAAADLGEHYAAGRLTLDELHERLDAVFAAKTVGQLTPIMADLPGTRSRGPFPPGSGLPGTGRPPWTAGGSLASPAYPGPFLYGSGWGPAGFYDDRFPGMSAETWPPAEPETGSRSSELGSARTPTDRAGRVAALSLLLLAMLIWLFTALLFARHGLDQPATPMGPPGSFSQVFPQGGG